ncbi:MAG TPA: DNA polymerase/3'-5' exonuclease PolX [Tepidisphaeraceae bacterium]
MSLNQEISDLFANLAAMMELKGENTFKVIAFQKVSRIIREMNFDLKKCVEENTLCEIEGIGRSSQQIIEEYINTGRSTVLEEISATIPKGLGELLRIEGLGPKTIHMLWQERSITSLAELKKAITGGGLAGLKGVGEKKIAAIEAGIAALAARASGAAVGGTHRVGIMEALGPAEELLARVRKIAGVEKAEIAGSLRRRKETIADVDIVAVAEDAEKVGAAFAKLPGIVQVIGQGATKTSVKIGNGMQVDLRVVPAKSFGAAMAYFTGSKEHNVKIRGLALKKGLTLNEWGFDVAEAKGAKSTPEKARDRQAVDTEEKVYSALGLEFIEPELREDRGEVELAAQGKLPKLIEVKDYRGDLHTHTTASDGVDTIEAMAATAKALGYEYLAITDHSKSQVIANGLSNERLITHIAAIHKAAAKIKGITLFAGAEVDIMADGRLDYEPEILKELDIVVASPHFSLKQEEKKATDRLKRAIDTRYVNIIGHPTGRLINRREGLPLDFSKLFPRAAAKGTALEINAGYPRLDLNDLNARAALQAGCVLSINTDSHSTGELETIWQGIWVARRAWATKMNVLNCWGIEEVKVFLAKKR